VVVSADGRQSTTQCTSSNEPARISYIQLPIQIPEILEHSQSNALRHDSGRASVRYPKGSLNTNN
jgi:hypothetical protein